MFVVDVLTPSKVVAEKVSGSSILIPTIRGQINVLPEHTHLVTKLDTGILEVSTESGVKKFVVTSGICKVIGNEIKILSLAAEKAEDIDPDRAKNALNLAIDKLTATSLTDEEVLKYRRKEARARLRVQLADAYLR